MSQNLLKKLPVNHFKWVEDISEIIKDFIKNYVENSNEWYFLEVDIQHSKILHKIHNALPFARNNETEKIRKLVAKLHDKNEHVIHVKS